MKVEESITGKYLAHKLKIEVPKTRRKGNGKFIEIKKLFSENKIEEAKKVQQTANKIITVLCKFGVMQSEKEVLNQLGFDFGICRKPFGALNSEQKEVIKNEILPLL